MESIQLINRDIAIIREDIELIKKVLLSEGEITPWARKAIEKARKEKEEVYVNLNDL